MMFLGEIYTGISILSPHRTECKIIHNSRAWSELELHVRQVWHFWVLTTERHRSRDCSLVIDDTSSCRLCLVSRLGGFCFFRYFSSARPYDFKGSWSEIVRAEKKKICMVQMGFDPVRALLADMLQGFLLGALHWGRNPPPDSCGWGGNLISKNIKKIFRSRVGTRASTLRTPKTLFYLCCTYTYIL